ncbi:MAG: hypothetical protein HY814_08775 [Candidatus Riflebacteria bacterium]|nr:hypothetical protein [Candidatus Riflebacteria bacterium]
MGFSKNILLAGLPRVGKTTVVQKILSLAKVRFGGFYTQAVDETARQRDFKLVTLEGRNRSISRKHLIQRFELASLIGVDLADLRAKGVGAIHGALERCQAIVVDEIGRHEALCRELQDAVLAAMDSPLPVLATVPAYGTPFIEALKLRKDTSVVEVTVANRVLLPEPIARHLTGLVRSAAGIAPLPIDTGEEQDLDEGDGPRLALVARG